MDINLITDNPQFLTGYLGNFFGLNQRYSDILAVIKNTLLFEPQEHVLGPTWFLSALFSALVLYAGVKLILIKTFHNRADKSVFIDNKRLNLNRRIVYFKQKGFIQFQHHRVIAERFIGFSVIRRIQQLNAPVG